MVVGRDEHGLALHDVIRGAAGEIWWMDAEITEPGLRAELRVSAHYAVGFDDLLGLFADMVRDWRGWNGDRIYESLEGNDLVRGSDPGRIC